MNNKIEFLSLIATRISTSLVRHKMHLNETLSKKKKLYSLY